MTRDSQYNRVTRIFVCERAMFTHVPMWRDERQLVGLFVGWMLDGWKRQTIFWQGHYARRWRKRKDHSRQLYRRNLRIDRHSVLTMLYNHREPWRMTTFWAWSVLRERTRAA